jgi:UDPglucose 6-dehydrogenase
MRIAVFGAGYVGLVTGACLADLGHEVVVRDVVAEKIDTLRRGEVPIYEQGLAELLERNRERLTFTTDVAEAVNDSEVVYVAVGTPPTYSGDADLSAVWTVIDELPHTDSRIVVAMKSTVPVGTGRVVRHRLEERGLGNVGYVSNPEFTAEGTAVRDFMHPDRIVIGSFDEADADVVERLHDGLGAPIIRCDVASAEMIKLAANAALVTRISFINEIANVCEATGADVVKVAEGIGLDRRIGPAFLRAGIGFGGSCLHGSETALVRADGRTWLTRLDRLHSELDGGLGRGALAVRGVDVLSWAPGAAAPEFRTVSHVTRRRYDGEMIEIETKMGRRLRCTADHPLVVGDGDGGSIEVKAAAMLTSEDWLPVVVGNAPAEGQAEIDDLLEGLAAEGLEHSDVIVRPREDLLARVGSRALSSVITSHPRGRARLHDIVRTGTLRLPEALEADLSLAGAMVKTARNGTEVPVRIVPDERFWRVAGLYAAEGHCSGDGRRRRLTWSFHPYAEDDLIEEVASYWRSLGVRTEVRRKPTATTVTVSSRVLAGWWLGPLGMGATCYDQAVPDALWSGSSADKRAFLSGAWNGDGSWSRVNRGPYVVLEYGTVSPRLADGILRLLGDLGVVARLKVGRTAKSTVDTYWLVVSGADQVESSIELVKADQRERVLQTIEQIRRIAPTGYRPGAGVAWVRVKRVQRTPFSGHVYSLEVPETGTFVTTGGLAVHNCFPKDSLALKQLAANSGYNFQLLNAVIEVNELQKRRVVGKLKRRLGSLRGKKVALLGLAFKPGTDDTREAPSLVLAGRLLAEGAHVSAWDPVADARLALDGVEITGSALEALTGADAAVLVTEWPELADLDWGGAAKLMRNALLVDGRNMLDADELRALGFEYEGIGRASE